MKSKSTALLAMCVLATAGCKEDPPNATCTEHEECFENEYCVSGRCEVVYGASYVVVVEGATYLPVADPNGDFWDPVGGEDGTDPDPYATFYDLDGALCTTRRATDTRTPTWSYRCPGAFTVEETSLYGWSIYDDDEEDDPRIIGTPDGEEFPIEVEWVRTGEFSLSQDGVSIHFAIEPR